MEYVCGLSPTFVRPLYIEQLPNFLVYNETTAECKMPPKEKKHDHQKDPQSTMPVNYSAKYHCRTSTAHAKERV